jgi:hypothetical protein
MISSARSTGKRLGAGAENCEDGTLAHALERLFLPVVENRGYRWKKVLYAPKSMQKPSL